MLFVSKQDPIDALKHAIRRLEKLGLTEHEYNVKVFLSQMYSSDDSDMFLASRLASLIQVMLSNPDDEKSYTIAKNALSIAAVPKEYISQDERKAYIAQAEDFQDIYAYNSGPDAWYLWDTDTRILLPKLSDIKWNLVKAEHLGGDNWAITIEQMKAESQIFIHIPAVHSYAHGLRVVKVLVGHVNKWDSNPLGYNGCTFNG
jgi:hypothetical protein